MIDPNEIQDSKMTISESIGKFQQEETKTSFSDNFQVDELDMLELAPKKPAVKTKKTKYIRLGF